MISALIFVTIFTLVLVAYVLGGFEPVGLRFPEVLAIIFLPLVFNIVPPVHVATFNDVYILAEFSGFLVPLLISLYFIYSGKFPFWKFGIGITVVSAVSYYFSDISGVGVVVYNLLLISAVSAVYSVLVENRGIGALAYSCSTLGVFIGSDLVRILSFSSKSVITIGGGGLSDAIFISGISSILVALFLMHLFQIKNLKSIEEL